MRQVGQILGQGEKRAFNVANYRPPQTAVKKRHLLFLIVLPLILAVGVAAIMLGERGGDASTLDGDLCPETGSIEDHAVFLLDLRKPLGDAHRSLPGALLQDVTLHLEAGSELRVFNLTGDLAMPTRLVGRVCKPYGNAELTVAGGAGQPGVAGDCDDLPTGLDDAVRDRAARFCALRRDLRLRIDDIARRPNDAPVANAYLMEAIEDTSLALADRAGSRALFVFSDMMQHAAWYSHPELGEDGWSFDDFTDLRHDESTLVGETPRIADLRVHVFYAPRVSLTDEPSAELAHKRFWQSHFAANRLTFKNVPVLPPYEVEPLMSNLPEAARLERQRRDYQRRRQRAETTLRELQEELSELQDQRDLATGEVPGQALEPESGDPERSAERVVGREAPEVRDRTPPPVADVAPAVVQPEPPPPEPVVNPAAQSVEPPVADAGTSPGQSSEQPPAETGTVLGQPAEPLPAELGTAQGQLAEQPPVETGTTLEQPGEPPPAETAIPLVEPAERLADDVPAAATPPPAQPQPVPPGLPDDPSSSLSDSPPMLAVEPPPCTVRAKRRTDDIYPHGHRVNYGAAEIVVRYTVDERGQTEDDGVMIVAGESSATRPRYFELFAETAVEEIEKREFDFVDVDDGCRKRQEIKTKMVFQFSRSFRR